MSTRMALTSFLPVAVKQAWNFALFTGSDTHRLKLAGSHAYIANRQHIDRPFAGDAAHHKSHFVHMRTDHHLRTCRLIESDQHRSQPIKSHFFLQAIRFFPQDLPYFLF